MRLPALLLIVLAAAFDASVAAAPDTAFVARVEEAIGRAVVARLGANADVRVADTVVTATPADGPIDVTPAPDAKVGRPSLFSLTVEGPAGARRIGSAMATVHVDADVIRATRALMRGDTLAEDDVVIAKGSAHGASLKALPAVAEVIGSRMTRAVPEGGLLSADVLSVPWSVRSGQQVHLRVVIGGIEARGMGVATENGRLGAVVRVVNPDSRRTVVGRVVGVGEVEVQHGS